MQADSEDRKDRRWFQKLSAHWVSTATNALLLFVLAFQTYDNRAAIYEGTEQFETTIDEIRRQSETFSRILVEQQRARLSFRVELEQLEDESPSGFRIVLPIEVGGMTDARHVRLKNYVGPGRARQSQYISFANIDWEQREGHELGDVSPTETGRRFVADLLSPQQLALIVSGQQSLYFIAKLDYCDIYGECRYFMRCAELGNRPGIVTYCGTRAGQLNDAEENEQTAAPAPPTTP